MRARYPDRDGYIERGGVKVFFEVYGGGTPTILLLPTWSIVHSRRWKGQISYLARHFRVLTFDGRGNGRSDRPSVPEAYADTEIVADALAVLDATDTPRAVIAGMSMGAGYGLRLAAQHADRILGAVFIGPAVGLAEPARERYDFWEEPQSEDGWARYNAHYWRKDWPAFAEFFMGQVFTEPHSTKHIEDGVAWATETDPETLLAAERADYLEGSAEDRGGGSPVALDLAARVTCPCLVVHGSGDHIIHASAGERLAAALNCPLVIFEGSGHAPDARSPVRFNILLRDFVRGLAAKAGSPALRRREG
jgi:pimeloyl-ACP methyl ester carboxylesterase